MSRSHREREDDVIGASRRAGIAFALLTMAAAVGCAGARVDRPAGRPNVLLITIDTLRADKLGCYGSDLGATPRIDSLATESVRFEHAYAHSPWTLPSFASLFTSLHPPEHGAGGFLRNFSKLAEDRRTLAECFRDAGYATAAVVNVDFLTESFGMTQGFEHVDFEVYPDNVRVRTADRTTDAALAWLRAERSRPFLLLVHYFDPHMVYAPPAAYRARFAAPRDREPDGWTFGTRAQIVGDWQERVRFDEETIRRAEKLYHGEVAYTDHEVGRLLDGASEMGLLPNTIVVFTTDHGEEFRDHGGIAHGHTVYEEQVRVPLLISWRGKLAPGSAKATVGQVDVAPTLCELTGVESPPEFVGRSLVPYFDDPDGADRPVLLAGNFWGPPILGWLAGGYKLIVHPDDRTELYDLRRDRAELNDLAGHEEDRVRRMRGDLELALRKLGAHSAAAVDTLELTPEQEERLRALGYLD